MAVFAPKMVASGCMILCVVRFGLARSELQKEIDASVEKLLDHALQASPFHDAQLDSTTVGKSAHAAFAHTTAARSLRPLGAVDFVARSRLSSHRYGLGGGTTCASIAPMPDCHRTGLQQHFQLRAEQRAGDLGENAGESYFPKGPEETVQATGEVLPTEPSMRIGHGYDIHRMLPRDDPEAWGKVSPQPAVIGGVTFDDFPLGVVAHSDGDVIYHSTTDAILGSLGLPDIGQLFPDNDPRWRGANSEQFFDEAVRLMELRGYRIANLDVTIIAEKPRLAARKPAMKDNLVRISHTVPARVNIKARTHEKVDAVGECRALECHVCVLLERAA
eukprot:gnl/TRDRNA2_/TRDRNA2_85146_c0_seq1.p1 gnl/TRDRNA2_/TRDRNA2_85146_c0~~gnl/TRDRNA2_/TRDRNA2_85146_c0_seq1.p1  ORF type:complete len:355 (-),score=57.92 gnl/TRDRNA2_/TRDRNA2_85146_c0_seq1:24-1019(-)